MTDLTDRMRTCAAAIIASKVHEWDDADGMAMRDAADLLLEASNELDKVPEPLGEPMEILEPLPPPAPKAVWGEGPKATWVTGLDTLPPPVPGPPSWRHPRVCPACDSRAHKRVTLVDRKVMLTCPACSTAWEYKP